MGGLPRLPLTIFERVGIAERHSSLSRDQLAYFDLVANRQQRSYYVGEQHALTFSRIDHRNSSLFDIKRRFLN